jgi:hypothetical protein
VVDASLEPSAASIAAADTKASCRVAPVPVTRDAFNARGASSLLDWQPANKTVGVSLSGIAGGTVTSLYKTHYGMYSAYIKANTNPGVVTAFYVSYQTRAHACVYGCCCHGSPCGRRMPCAQSALHEISGSAQGCG